jgi:hypothetical protein
VGAAAQPEQHLVAADDDHSDADELGSTRRVVPAVRIAFICG